MSVYYNENDPKAAAWLRELIRRGLIADGILDTRSIAEVQASDLDGFIQCHFFAGIGGWSYALRLAGWPDDKPVWTGSCPCQPFSVAGKRKGKKDSRHLWPQFRRIIRKRRPSIVFGEQVANSDGRIWLDGVFADLEALAYVNCGADLCAAGVGAPHIRQRLFWMAHTDGWKSCDRELQRGGQQRQQPQDSGPSERLEHSQSDGRQQRGSESSGGSIIERCGTGGLGDTNEPGPQGQHLRGDGAGQRIAGPSGLGFWDDFELIPCADGKQRRIEPGSSPLAIGIPGRVGLLRGYGNAINPQIAAQFIQASQDALLDLELSK